MCVLVTGSSGRLGGVIIELLKKRGIKCIGIDLNKSETTDNVVDIRSSQQLKKLSFRKIEYVIHTAAVHGKHLDFNVPREKFVETNILGTLNLLELCSKYNVKKFIYTSSTSVYGTAMSNSKSAVWVDENLIPVPRDIYDITKLTAENLCKDFFEKEGLVTSVLRVSRFMVEPENKIINYRLYRGVNIVDAATSHYLLIQSNIKSFEVFNISNRSPFNKNDLRAIFKDPKKMIIKYFPESEEYYRKKNLKFPDSIDRVYDITKAQKILNYNPKINFSELLK